MNLTILHIADLHFSKEKDEDIKIIRNGLFKDLEFLSNKHSLTPDLVFFTGDLILKGQDGHEDYPLCEQLFIEPLLSKLSLTQNEFFIVPGNHDVNRLKTSEAFETKLSEYLSSKDILNNYFKKLYSSIDFEITKKKFDNYLQFKSKQSNSNIINSNFFYETFRISVSGIEVGIIALNSSWRSSQFGPDKGRLIIGDNNFNNALLDIENCQLKFVLSHHPFEMLSAWDSKNLQITMARSIDMFFTGHIHDSDFMYTNQIYGSLYVSTCGSLYSGRVRESYSVINLDLTKKELKIFLRRWYDKRHEFDQETEKVKNGLITYENFTIKDKIVNELIEISSLKNKLQSIQLPANIIFPFENIEKVQLEDVFVEPLISDKSSFDKDSFEKNHIKLSNIINSNKNIIFFGKKEYGKTSLLKHIQSEILKNESEFEGKIPVYIEFSQISKNNYKAIKRIIRTDLEGLLTDDLIEKYLVNGNFVFLVDDYDDFKDGFRDKRKKVFNLILKTYPKCRYIITTNEKISQTFKQESFSLDKYLPYDNYYLSSFNTAAIRNLLEKWCRYQDFDVDRMLDQIIFYFHQLKIPITPMAVTLFIGVLIRDKASINLNNEAYLIENYLETILEKLDPSDPNTDLDFREKESFLSHLAYEMVRLDKYEFSEIEFERCKLDYFTEFDEDLPDNKSFDPFFSKGILQKKNKLISFQFKFWFYFFLAKAMQKDNVIKNEVLSFPNYLKFSTAFSYEAGLSRNDKELLDIIDERTQAVIDDFFKSDANKNLEQYQIESGLSKFSDKIETQIREKNVAENKDKIKDETYLSYNPEEQNIPDEDEYDDIIQLVTLNSDLIRNTREIKGMYKEKFLKNNINSYLALMWQTLEIFRETIDTIDEDSLKKLLNDNGTIDENDFDYEKIVKRIREFTYQVIPLSIILFMSDHLQNPKLKNTVKKLIHSDISLTDRLFYSLLLFRLEIESGLEELHNLLKDSKSSYIYDHLIYLFIIIFCYSNKLDDRNLNLVIKLLNEIRKKYSTVQKELPLFVKDTFTSDIKKSILLKGNK